MPTQPTPLSSSSSYLPRDNAQVGDHHAVVVGKSFGEKTPSSVQVTKPDFWTIYGMREQSGKENVVSSEREREHSMLHRSIVGCTTFKVHEHHVAIRWRRLEGKRGDLFLHKLRGDQRSERCGKAKSLKAKRKSFCFPAASINDVQFSSRCDADPLLDNTLGTCVHTIAAYPGSSSTRSGRQAMYDLHRNEWQVTTRLAKATLSPHVQTHLEMAQTT